MKDVCTGSQTVGPFFRIGLDYLFGQTAEQPAAGSLTVRGLVLDANRNPVPDAMIELWYADPAGRYATEPSQAGTLPGCLSPGFARVDTAGDGTFGFSLVKPGPVPFDDSRTQAPHVEVLFFARGLLRHMITRMYFPGEAANAADPVLQSVPENRRATLIAQPDPQHPDSLLWNIVLQGEQETVFFAW